jgi:hypothetical protein
MRALRLIAMAALAAAGLTVAAQVSAPRPPQAPAGRPDEATETAALNQAVVRANTEMDERNAAASARYEQAMAAYARTRADGAAGLPAPRREPVRDDALADASPRHCRSQARGSADCYPATSAMSVMPAALSAAISSRMVASSSVALRPLSTRLDP